MARARLAGEPAGLAHHGRVPTPDRPAAQRVGPPAPRGHHRSAGAARRARGARARRSGPIGSGRHADAPVHVLPPRSVRGVPDRPHPARRRRADHRRDRPGLPGPGGDHGPAHQPGQAADQGRRQLAPACRRSRSGPGGSGWSSTCCTSSSTRATPRPSAPDLQRSELTGEAIRLTRAVHRLLPDDGEVAGLLALMLLTDARRPARTGPDGGLVPLAEQDRGRWNREAIREGIALVTEALPAGPVGPYQLQAAIGCRPRRSPERRRHRLGPDRRPVRAARAHRTQSHGHAQPRRRGGHDTGTAGRASTCCEPWTPTTAWSVTIASTPFARICWRWPATSMAPAPATGTQPAAPPAFPSGATSRPERPASPRPS